MTSSPVLTDPTPSTHYWTFSARDSTESLHYSPLSWQVAMVRVSSSASSGKCHWYLPKNKLRTGNLSILENHWTWTGMRHCHSNPCAAIASDWTWDSALDVCGRILTLFYVKEEKRFNLNDLWTETKVELNVTTAHFGCFTKRQQ